MKKYNKLYFLSIVLFIALTYSLIGFVNDFKYAVAFMSIIIILLISQLFYYIEVNKKALNLEINNNRKYNLAIDLLEVIVWEWDSEVKQMFMSPKIKDMIRNYSKDSFTFIELINYIVEEDREYVKNFFYDLIQDKVTDNFTLECSIINEIKEKIVIKIEGKTKLKDNTLIVSGYLKDITLKKHKENINRIIENKNRLALEGSKDITFWLNVNQSILSLDRSIRNYIDFDGERDLLISYSNWKKNILEEDLEKYDKKILDIIKDKDNSFYSIEYRIRNKDGKITWFESKGKKTYEKNGDIFLYGSMSDITGRKENELRQECLTYTDEVTGIPNRRYFFKEVEEYIQNYKGNLAIIFIDLDNFKYINDNYGHNIGDILLKKFSKVIEDLDIEDSLFSRYGGDEFILAKYNYNDIKDIEVILEKIIKMLSKPLTIKDKELFCTISIGVSIYPDDGIELNDLIKKADMAMYLAKINGKNRYEVFDEKMLKILDREFEIEKGLRLAIENNEISILYQPKFSIKEEKIVGFEALVRWESKELGFVSPKEFIPIAESSGLIIPIGNYIIKQTIRNCREILLETDEHFKMAINISDVQIRDSRIVRFINSILNKYEIPANYIEFEITESIIMKNPEKNIETLENIKALGSSLALDDFGTGYSSLSYLNTLPLDVLKIDKTFIGGIGIDDKSEYIIKSIINLSHYLNLNVVAEGVETKEQLEYLKEAKCDIIQGYYFSKPIKFSKAKKMILNK